MNAELLLTVIFILMTICYGLGRYHQKLLDDNVPILFLYKGFKKMRTQDKMKDYNDFANHEVHIFLGEWVAKKSIPNLKGIIIPCGKKDTMFFRDNIKISEDDLVMVNTVAKRKLQNYRYLYIRFITAMPISPCEEE